MATNGATEQVSAIKSDLDALRSDLTKLMSDVSGLQRTARSEAKGRIEDGVSHMSDKVSATMEELSQEIHAKSKTARQVVRENPISSVAAAFTAGLVVSRLLR